MTLKDDQKKHRNCNEIMNVTAIAGDCESFLASMASTLHRTLGLPRTSIPRTRPRTFGLAPCRQEFQKFMPSPLEGPDFNIEFTRTHKAWQSWNGDKIAMKSRWPFLALTIWSAEHHMTHHTLGLFAGLLFQKRGKATILRMQMLNRNPAACLSVCKPAALLGRVRHGESVRDWKQQRYLQMQIAWPDKPTIEEHQPKQTDSLIWKPRKNKWLNYWQVQRKSSWKNNAIVRFPAITVSTWCKNLFDKKILRSGRILFTILGLFMFVWIFRKGSSRACLHVFCFKRYVTWVAADHKASGMVQLFQVAMFNNMKLPSTFI